MRFCTFSLVEWLLKGYNFRYKVPLSGNNYYLLKSYEILYIKKQGRFVLSTIQQKPSMDATLF